MLVDVLGKNEKSRKGQEVLQEMTPMTCSLQTLRIVHLDLQSKKEPLEDFCHNPCEVSPAGGPNRQTEAMRLSTC